MSMTLEEAVELLCYGDWLNVISEHIGKQDTERIAEAMSIVGKALRPVSREQVEKVWRGEWEDMREAYNDVPKRRCSRCKSVFIGLDTPFCDACGAPMTDEAVEMVMERLEELKDES